MKRWFTAIAASIAVACAVLPALGQWQVPTSSIPVGRGAGVTGFNSVGPTANTILNWGTGGTPQATNILTGENYNAAMTNSGEAYGYSFRNSIVTGADLFSAIYGSTQNVQDGVQSVLNVPNTATVLQANAVAGYYRNLDATANAVGLFTAGTCEISSTACWGGNTLLMDNPTRATGSLTGIVLQGWELDFNVMNTDTQVIGVSVGGNSLAQSNNAIAFIANTLGNSGPYRWQTGFFCIDGAVSEYCVAAGPATSSGTSTSSLKFIQQYFDGSSNKKTLTMQSSTGLFALSNDESALTLRVGISGSSIGALALTGNTSGTVTITPQAAAGTATFTLPNTSGTPAISVPSPLSLSATSGAVTWSGLTSGGVLYNSSTTTVASSAALAANTIVKGGGAGAAPTTTASCSIDANQSINCASSTSFNPAFNITNTTNDANYPNLRFIHGRGSSTGALTADDAMGALVFAGGDGTGQINAAHIIAYVDGALGTNDVPSRLVFQTTPDGSATAAEAMRITHKKHMAFSGTAPTLSAGCNGAGSSVSGTNVAGTVTGQTAAATTCTLTFANSGFASTPHCVASGQSSPLTGAFTPSTTTIVVNFASTANYKWSYHCFGI